jgi:hypothetical protein
MKMGAPDDYSSAVLSDSALQNGNSAAPNAEFFIKNAKHLVTIAGFFIKHPAKLYLSYHKIHFDILIKLLYAIKKAEPLEQKIQELKTNIDSYCSSTGQLAAETRKIPSHPLKDENPLLLLILVPILREDPVFRAGFNDNLDIYERLVNDAFETASACADTGRGIERDTPEQIQQLRSEADKLAGLAFFGPLLQAQYHKNLDFIQLDLVTKVSRTRSSADDCVKYLLACRQKAAGIGRI